MCRCAAAGCDHVRMLILLPPSEGKQRPARGQPLALERFKDTRLNPDRQTVIDALVRLCRGSAETARDTLGIPSSLRSWIETNASLPTNPTAKAAAVYTGVLYAALDLASLHGTGLRRANSRLVVVSALFGLVRPTDRIGAYRLSAGVELPGVGPLTRFWRAPLADAIPAAAGSGMIIDMRSSPYTAMWSPGNDVRARHLAVKVWQRQDSGQRTAVSHHNKATKGSLARLLATAADPPQRPAGALALVRDAGWDAELDSTGARLDVYLRG